MHLGAQAGYPLKAAVTLLAMEAYRERRLPPAAATAVRITIESRPAMTAYSTAVAPDWQQQRMLRDMLCLPEQG